MDSIAFVKLSNKKLPDIKSADIIMPAIDYLKLPVKVLQFGTGVLLRGLTDHVIDRANAKGIFNGRIAIVKSTNTGKTDAFTEQDNLYTLQMKGIKNKQLTEETVINSSISRVLSAAGQWDLVLKEAENPQLKIIISNTTEVGIQLVEEDINQQPPASFPAKLLAVLYHRYKTFKGSNDSGLVIIPTELLPDNATILKSIITQLIAVNKLDTGFEKWVNESNYFCNSLVDRIVTGKPSVQEQQLFEEQYGYHDDLLIISEPYLLWAIEGNDAVKDILGFEQASEGVVVIPDIGMHRELKLRMLNGTHTLSCALAFLTGFEHVNTASEDPQFSAFLQSLMAEIRSAIPYKVDQKLAEEFSENVLDRFRNPYIQHQWIAISQQYTTKLITRVLPILNQYYKLYNRVPQNLAKGFAAYILFISTVKKDNDGYYALYKNVKHPFKDDKAGVLIEKWADHPVDNIAAEILGSVEVWGEDLTALPGFANAVQNYLTKLTNGNLTTASNGIKLS